MKRGRKPKPYTVLRSVPESEGGGVRLLTLPGPAPARSRGRPRGTSQFKVIRRVTKDFLDRPLVAPRVVSATLRAMDRVEYDKSLCTAVIDCIRERDMFALWAIRFVARKRCISELTVRDAYYRYRNSFAD